ncbi:MAG: hypothetical protein M3O70_01640 [Actinomycetota bacterium]|nr:hypothetical protein [Actinomycetota bacterium]
MLALCAIEGVTGTQWEVVAREASPPQGLRDLLQGVVRERTPTAAKLRDALARGLTTIDGAREWAAAQVDAAGTPERRSSRCLTTTIQ